MKAPLVLLAVLVVMYTASPVIALTDVIIDATVAGFDDNASDCQCADASGLCSIDTFLDAAANEDFSCFGSSLNVLVLPGLHTPTIHLSTFAGLGRVGVIIFEGLEREQAEETTNKAVPPDPMGGKEALDLIRSYYSIPEKQRRPLFDLARVMSNVS